MSDCWVNCKGVTSYLTFASIVILQALLLEYNDAVSLDIVRHLDNGILLLTSYVKNEHFEGSVALVALIYLE